MKFRCFTNTHLRVQANRHLNWPRDSRYDFAAFWDSVENPGVVFFDFVVLHADLKDGKLVAAVIQQNYGEAVFKVKFK